MKSLVCLAFFFVAGPLEADEPVWGPFAHLYDLAAPGGHRNNQDSDRGPAPGCHDQSQVNVKDPTIDIGAPTRASTHLLSPPMVVVTFVVDTTVPTRHGLRHFEDAFISPHPDNHPLRTVVLIL